MFRPLALYIGARYTRAKRRNHYISFISLASMIGLALGVLAVIVVLSVMNGQQREMRSRILGMVSHANLQSTQGPLDDWSAVAALAKQNPQVLAAVPFTTMDGMLSKRGMVHPIQVDGIDPALQSQVSILGQHLQSGRLDALKPGEFGVVIGDITALRMRLSVGDNLLLIVPESSSAPGGITPRLQRLKVVGIFKVGAELDGQLAMIHIADAAKLLRWQDGQVQSVRLALKDLFEAPQIAAEIAHQLGENYRAIDWTHTQGSLFSAMKMEKTMIGLLLMLIVAVAAFNIITTLIMVVADKRMDIAILRTLGATPRQIMAIFMVQGSLIGTVGTFVGGLLGILVAANVTPIVSALEWATGTQMFDPNVFFVDYLPSEVQAFDVLLICSAGLLMSFLATLYPAWRAACTQPAEALRYE